MLYPCAEAASSMDSIRAAKKGLAMLATMTPSVDVYPDSWGERGKGYPSLAAAARTSCTVFAATPLCPDRAREAVEIETPANPATSTSLGLLPEALFCLALIAILFTERGRKTSTYTKTSKRLLQN